MTTNDVLIVRFTTGREYRHSTIGDRESRATVEGWQHQGGIWLIEEASRHRVWCPWHTVTEVVLPKPPHASVVGGSGPAVRRPAG